MAEPFVLTAVPKLLPEGPFQGHLEYVEFKADNGKASHLWWSTNTGTYVEDFARIMPKAEAYAIVAALRRGETVIVPGYWALSEIRHKFGGSGNE
jgi:hypothetical protein